MNIQFENLSNRKRHYQLEIFENARNSSLPNVFYPLKPLNSCKSRNSSLSANGNRLSNTKKRNLSRNGVDIENYPITIKKISVPPINPQIIRQRRVFSVYKSNSNTTQTNLSDDEL